MAASVLNFIRPRVGYLANAWAARRRHDRALPQALV
jgi:hypothetical protein